MICDMSPNLRLSLSSFSSSGGAGGVNQNLRKGFESLGHHAEVFSVIDSSLREKPLKSPMHVIAASVDEYLLKRRSWGSQISLARDVLHPLNAIDFESFDMNIIRWPNGAIDLRYLAGQKSKFVFGLDDENIFTGVCHYSLGCSGFQNGCENCPAIQPVLKSIARTKLEQKIAGFQNIKAAFVAPTAWIATQFNSSFFSKALGVRAKTVPNPIAGDYFDVTSKQGRPVDPTSITIGFAAADIDNPIKGFDEFASTMSNICHGKNLRVKAAGKVSRKTMALYPLIDFEQRVLSSTEMRSFYDSIDVLVVSSHGENAGTVFAEAASRGVPTIARRVGGMVEAVGSGKRGWLFEDEKGLAELVLNLTWTDIRRKGASAKLWSQEFSPEKVALRYINEFS